MLSPFERRQPTGAAVVYSARAAGAFSKKCSDPGQQRSWNAARARVVPKELEQIRGQAGRGEGPFAGNLAPVLARVERGALWQKKSLSPSRFFLSSISTDRRGQRGSYDRTRQRVHQGPCATRLNVILRMSKPPPGRGRSCSAGHRFGDNPPLPTHLQPRSPRFCPFEGHPSKPARKRYPPMA